MSGPLGSITLPPHAVPASPSSPLSKWVELELKIKALIYSAKCDMPGVLAVRLIHSDCPVRFYPLAGAEVRKM